MGVNWRAAAVPISPDSELGDGRGRLGRAAHTRGQAGWRSERRGEGVRPQCRDVLSRGREGTILRRQARWRPGGSYAGTRLVSIFARASRQAGSERAGTMAAGKRLAATLAGASSDSQVRSWCRPRELTDELLHRRTVLGLAKGCGAETGSGPQEQRRPFHGFATRTARCECLSALRWPLLATRLLRFARAGGRGDAALQVEVYESRQSPSRHDVDDRAHRVCPPVVC